MPTQRRTRELVQTAMMCAVLCVMAIINIPIGAVPFSMAIFGVALAGAMLRPPMALACVGCYLLLGLIGLPVFAGGGRAGPGVLAGPTGGYLAGYFLLALACSLAMRRPLAFPAKVCLSALGMAACYLLGTLWYAFVTGAGFLAGLSACVLPFALPDLIKITLALGVAGILQKHLQRSVAP